MIWEGLTVPTLEGFTGFVPPQGDGTSHVMIMGEAPGELEARDSIPFHPKAPAGSTLDRLLRRVRMLMLHRQVAWEAGRIERELAQTGGRLGENDNWIAATARTWGLRLVSRDEAFTRVPRLDVVSY